MKGTLSRERLVLLAIFVILLVFGLLVVRKYMTSTRQVSSLTQPEPEPKQLREVVLYFGSPEGSYLVAEAREIDGCLNEADCLRETVQALVDGPVHDLVPVIPSHAVVRDATQSEGTATVDFSRELVTGHPGGSVSELLTIYSLADTLAENFPHIRQVRILVEGEPIESLKGHVDLREPIKADFGFTRPPEGAPGTSGPGGQGEKEPAQPEKAKQ